MTLSFLLRFGTADVSRTPETIDEASLRSLPIGQATLISDLSSFDAALVCVLYPYQDHLDDDVALADRINAHIDTTKYAGDEGYWSMVLVGKETIKLVAFWRSSQLDILAEHEISTVVAEMLPEHFTPKYCVNGANAAMAKIEFRDRTYIVLGEID